MPRVWFFFWGDGLFVSSFPLPLFCWPFVVVSLVYLLCTLSFWSIYCSLSIKKKKKKIHLWFLIKKKKEKEIYLVNEQILFGNNSLFSVNIG